MIYIVILICIPIFFVGLSMYMYTMYDFIINNNLDVALMLISVFATILTSYLSLKEIGLLESNSYKVVKFQSRIDSIIGVVSFTLLLVFGISLIANNFINGMNYSKLLIGVSIVILYTYIIYINFLHKKEYVFKIIGIDKIGDKLFLVTLDNKTTGLVEMYLDNKNGIKKNKSYKCYYNNYNKRMVKILNEVVDVN